MGRSRETTNAELAVLSLVAEGDTHGYEIEEAIEGRGMREWTEIGFSSIYHILGALEKRGLVVTRIEPAPGRGSPRKVHRITSAGRKAYRAGVLDALSRPRRLYPLIQQGLAGLPLLEPSAAADALRQYAARLDERLAKVRAADRGDLPFHVRCMFDYSDHMVSAERQWVEELARHIDAQGETGGNT